MPILLVVLPCVASGSTWYLARRSAPDVACVEGPGAGPATSARRSRPPRPVVRVETGAEADGEHRAEADVETEAEREADPEAAKRHQLAAIAEAARAEAAGAHDAEADEPSPRADRAPPGADPEIEAERRSDQELRARFAREPVDRAWAHAAERFGAGLLARSPDLRDATITCRSTMCEIRSSIPEDRAEELVGELTSHRDAHLFFGSLRNTGDEDPDDATYAPIWYLLRASAPARLPAP